MPPHNKSRARPSGSHAGSSSSHSNGPQRKRQNRGRQEMREVTRNSRRPDRRSEFENEGEGNGDDEEDNKGESDSDEDEDGDVGGDVTEEKGKAYSALLTLLEGEEDEDESEDEEEEEEEAHPKENLEQQSEVSDEEEDEDQVAGVVPEEVEVEEEVDDDEEGFLGIDSDDEDSSDPFESHFANSSDDYLKECIDSLQFNKWKNTKSQTESHSCIISYPPVESSKKHQKLPSTPSLESYNIKQKVLESFKSKHGGDSALDNPVAQQIFDPMMSYKDVLYPYVNFQDQEQYVKLYAMHALNHIHKTRDRVMKNTMRLKLQNEKLTNGKLKPEDEREFRDQGFTRPKVLIVLPTRSHCYKVMQEFISLCGVEQVENQKKFKNQFWDEGEIPDTKPDDFKDLFDGSSSDFFCLGVKMTRKSMKLYSSFYQSDIIFASPLGLHLILNNPDLKKRQTDFLSSIEILIMDRAHAIEMQNWDNVLSMLKFLNKVPEQMHDTDFSRVRMWSIDDEAKHYTQTLVFTEYNTPNVNNLLSRSGNIFGKYRFRPLISVKESGMHKVGIKIKQIFSRFDSASPMTEPDDRFNYFKSVIVPSLTKQTSYEDGLLLYIPSYTDFIRIKNYLHQKTSLSFTDVNEYSKQKDLTRARALFQQGRMKIMLYTERLHHFNRYNLKGVKNVLMYGVPQNPIFYTEVVTSIARSVFEDIADFNISSVRVLYSKWDAMALERVVGSERAPVLTHGQNEFYEFR